MLYLILFNSAQLYHLTVGTLNHAFPCQEEGTKVYNQAYHYWWSNLKRVRKRNGTSLYFASCSRWLLADDVKQIPFPILFLHVSSHPERNRISRCIQNSTARLAMDDSYLPQKCHKSIYHIEIRDKIKTSIMWTPSIVAIRISDATEIDVKKSTWVH